LRALCNDAIRPKNEFIDVPYAFTLLKGAHMQRREFFHFSGAQLIMLGAISTIQGCAANGQLDPNAVQGILGAMGGAQGAGGGLTQADATLGLREALTRGAGFAVGKLGIFDGFWGNPQVKIPLPSVVQDVVDVARLLGQGPRIDNLHMNINRAAEQAVPQAKTLLVDAVHAMTLNDAIAIVRGGDNSATQFFKGKTEQPLFGKFLPIVTQVTGQVGLAQRYNEFISLVPVKGAERVENYVTQKSLDGLYTMIATEERAIRKDPIGTGSAILQKVFGRV
jgi:hypothetical protein